MGFNNFISKKKNTEGRWFSPSPSPSPFPTTTTTTTTNSPPPLSLWSYWPSSKNPKKVVFCVEKYDNDYNSDSWFTSSSEDEFDGHSCMTTSSDDERIEMELENIIDPQVKNSFESSMSGDNVMGESEAENELPFEEGLVIVKEPEDAYMDFKISMAEMVVARGLQSMEALQELLEWYLKANGEDRHDVIVEAFVDLVFELSPTSSPSS